MKSRSKDSMWIADGYRATPDIRDVWNPADDLLGLRQLESEIQASKEQMDIHCQVKQQVTKNRDHLETQLRKEKSPKKQRVLENLLLSMMPQEVLVRENHRKVVLRHQLLLRRKKWFLGNREPHSYKDFPYSFAEIKRWKQ